VPLLVATIHLCEKEAPRQRTVWLQGSHEAIQAARQPQETAELTAQSAQWAGIEGTHAQGLRQSRSRGLATTPWLQLLTAEALNVP
jgi:hypothetical protein